MASGDVVRSVRVEVLGPLRLIVDAAPVDVPGPKRRAVLALLALAGGRTVTVDRLVDALWPSEAPASGRQALHTHVSRLRGHLGPGAARLLTGHDGYRLDLGPTDVDALQARALLARARPLLPRDPTEALTLLRQAHRLWRGPVLADLRDVAPIAAAVEECSRLHQDVTDALIAGAIAAGEAGSVVDLAAAALVADPLREPAVLGHMRVLAATGQAPEALRIGREYRDRLVEDTGLDPSPALGALVREIAGGAAGPVPAGPARPARPATRLIGRGAHVAAVHRLLAAERLVTVVGPGGVGKTRVALEVALTGRADAVVLLAPVTDPAAVPHALAAALDVNVAQGDVLAACVAVLGDRPGLLVIDNCEHLLAAVRDCVVTLLASCPRLSVLATSREPLGLPVEYTSRLAPLDLPTSASGGVDVPSVALFLDRAGRVRPDLATSPSHLPVIAEIVRRLDGMPLAIELAAGRLSSMSLTDLRDRLDRSLDLLGGGRSSTDTRHRTLRATLEWSYELLSEDEQRLFRHLAVFVDGLPLAAAERLAVDLELVGDPGSVLARLVDASMVDVDFEAGTRYRMLETIRAFALDRLAASGEASAAADHLLRWAIELTSWLDATIGTAHEPEADATLRRELPNLRAAWRLARDRRSVDDAAAMVDALFDAVSYRDLVEMREWAEELADDPALQGHPRAAAVLGTAAEAAYHRGDQRRAEELARAGLQQATDARGRYSCLLTLSVVELARGAYADVVEHSLAAAAIMPTARESLGIAALASAYAGDLDRARVWNERGRAVAVSPTMLAWGAYVAGEIEGRAGRAEPAERHYQEALDLARVSGATFLVGVASVGLLTVRAEAGRIQDALVGYHDVIGYFARTGNWTHQRVTLHNLADLLRRLGDETSAVQLDAATDREPGTTTLGGRDTGTSVSPLDRRAVLEVAKSAIERNLQGPGRGREPRRASPARRADALTEG